MYLLDTNIFLELLLDREKKQTCLEFVTNNHGLLFVSEFSLHSVGVVLFRLKRPELFLEFLDDFVPTVEVLGLAPEELGQINTVSTTTGLDFDDAMQLCVAHAFELVLVSLDKDFLMLEGRSSGFAQVKLL